MALFGQQSNSSGPLFGAQSGQSNPSLFGSTTNTQAHRPPPLFGVSTTTSQPQSNTPQSASLFGNKATSAGLFGTPSSSAQPQNSNPFASTTTTTQQQGPSLFGSTTTTTQQQAPAPFGSATTTNQQQPALFGSATTQQQPPPSLFSNMNNPPTNTAQQSSLFSRNPPGANPQPSLPGTQPFTQSAQHQNRPSLSLFSNPARPAPRLPPLSLGQSQPPAQPSTGAKIDLPHLRGTTRFADLTDSLAAELSDMDAFLSREMGYSEQIDAMLPAHGRDVEQLPLGLEFLDGKVEAVEGGVDSAGEMVRGLKDEVQGDAEDCRRLFRSVENLKLPGQFQYSVGWPARTEGNESEDGSMDLTGFFGRQADEMKDTLGTYKKSLAEIEAHIRNVEMGVAQMGGQMAFRRGKGKEEQVRELVAVLREFEAGIMGMAARVGEAREGVQEVILKGR